MRLQFFLPVLLLSIFNIVQSNAQNQIPVFKDGIYASYEDFISNTPSVSFNDYDIVWGDSKFFNQLKIKNIEKRNVDKKERKVDGRNFWGICVDGIPYIQYAFGTISQIYFGNQAGSKKSKANFTRIRIIGNICHFNVEDYISNENRLSHTFHNQLSSNGRLVREQRIMKMSTGQVANFNENTLRAFIKDDQRLYSHFIKSESKEAKIFLYLQKYNERNPLMVVR